MKYIDPKSLTIGVLAASLVFACTDSNNKTTNSPSLVSEAKAATGVGDKWDDNQEWVVSTWLHLNSAGLITRFPIGKTRIGGKPVLVDKIAAGWEPFGDSDYRKRIK